MSLRTRLIAGLVVVVVALAAAGWITVSSTRGHLLDQIDEQLLGLGGLGRLASGAAPPGVPPDGGVLEVPVEEERERPPTPVWIGTLHDDGSITTVFRPSFDATQPGPDEANITDSLGAASGSEELLTIDSVPSGVRYRLRMVSGADGVVRLVALPLGTVDAAVRRLSVVVVAVTVGSALVLLFVIGTVLRLGVLPLRRMTEAASVIAEGDLSHRVVHGTSSTESDQLGAALNRMMGTIEAAFDDKGATEDRLRRFVADASHELRTPTSTIRGYAELYRLGGLSDTGQLEDAMRRTEQEAVRLGRLVDDLLLLARTDQGRPLDTAPVDLAAVATDVVRDARVAHHGRSIALETVRSAVVRGDGDRLRQVVANLVDNAVNHTPDGTFVRVTAALTDDSVVIEVSDDGPGIPPHVGQQVFDRFWRADRSRTRASGGSGLGLSIVRSIVEVHGGDVHFTSAPGQGATFIVRMPLARDQVPRESDSSAQNHHGAQGSLR